ncbi:MAG: RagB/SusD family nutrient uptake outer membrane protein [Prevotella sp.]|nr:RagB/SusD family nutrient uptake outer membrane protein [Prevotella sp.]
MNKNIFKYVIVTLALGMTMTSCDDFLDRPDEDNPSMSNYYNNDTEVTDGVLSLYSSVWNDFICRGYYKVGDVMSGNIYSGGSPYMTFTVNGSDEDIKSSSQSLWAANAHANTIYTYLKSAKCSESVRNATMGECLAWKAMAYFYLVRMFGDVPLVHDNTADIGNNTYNDVPLVQKADIYEYIVMTLEKAIELLPESNATGRIDRWGAKGLLAKVYLTKSGVNAGGNGQRDAEDLAKAAELAKDVIDNSGKHLMENYADIFIGYNNCCEESLIGWRWNCNPDIYTCANPLTSEICMDGFAGVYAWGDWVSPSADLMEAFNTSPLTDPAQRVSVDTRRKASFMMAGDVYDYFWRDKKYNNKINGTGSGFDYLQFLYDDDYYCDDNYAGIKKQGLKSMSGANIAKHQYGNIKDHELMFGSTPTQQRSSMSTHVLRLSDVYLIYAEAVIGNNSSTTDASAIDAFYQVRHRAIKNYTKPTSITLDDVLNERRLEFAFEGDYWYDLVRLSYYNVAKAKSIIQNQKRGTYTGVAALYKSYWESGGTWNYSPSSAYYDKSSETTINVNDAIFTLPMPSEDAEYNPHLLEDPVHVDVRATYSY